MSNPLTIGVLLLMAWTSTASGAPPNVVLIISDDQAYCDFGFMGGEQALTPHLDRWWSPQRK